MFNSGAFKPAWWLTNPHLQTIAPKYFRKSLNINVIKQTLETPDNDFIDLAWTELPTSSNKPIVLILHGLEGSIDSHYAKGMMIAIKASGWIGLLMHFRGCSGRPNRKAPSYHSGQTQDVSFLVDHLGQTLPDRLKAAIGFSLGGNVLTKYLAEFPNSPIKAAAVICAPLNLASCSQRINRGASKIYQRYLINMLKQSTLKKIQMKLLPQFAKEEVLALKTIYDFDNLVTAPINGYKDAEDYYRKASGQSVIGEIKHPMLIIHAKDDPFLSHEDIININKKNDNISFEICSHGGHVGFISGKSPFKPVYWLEQRVPNFLKAYLQ